MNIDDISSISKTDIARALGLQPKITDYIWPALGIFSVGALVGAGLALMFAPKAGAELRDEIGSKIDELAKRASAKKSEVEREVKSETSEAEAA